jgi:type II secretory pathway component PulF
MSAALVAQYNVSKLVIYFLSTAAILLASCVGLLAILSITKKDSKSQLSTAPVTNGAEQLYCSAFC